MPHYAHLPTSREVVHHLANQVQRRLSLVQKMATSLPRRVGVQSQTGNPKFWILGQIPKHRAVACSPYLSWPGGPERPAGPGPKLKIFFNSAWYHFTGRTLHWHHLLMTLKANMSGWEQKNYFDCHIPSTVLVLLPFPHCSYYSVIATSTCCLCVVAVHLIAFGMVAVF